MIRIRSRLGFGLALVFTVCLGACSSAPKSSRIQADDLLVITTEIRAALAASYFLADRSADSDEIILSLQKTVNLSTDIISTGERWYLVESVFDSIPMRQLRSAYNIRVVRPASHMRQGRDRGLFIESAQTALAPTHVLTATFRSMTRSGDNARTDAYACQFEIVELKSGAVVWSELFEFKREAIGQSWD